MEKRKIGYSVLVVILFAVICFLTVYILVNRKAGDDCAKNQLSQNSTNLETTKTKIYINEDIAGVYEVIENANVPTLPNIEEITSRLTLGTDGTFKYESILIAGYVSGNYYIEDNKIILNELLKGGSDTSVKPINEQKIIEITDNGMIDNTPEYSEYIGKNSITLVKKTDFEINHEQPLSKILKNAYLDNENN